MPAPEPVRVLAIGAHPDDVEIGCGGTLGLLARGGAEVTVLCATSGDAGSLRDEPATLAATREAEARAAARILGLREVQFLGLRDGLTGSTREDKVRLIGILRRLRPHRVFVHARVDAFPDHRVVHQLAWGALLGASGPWYQEAGGEPWAAGTVLGYEVWHPLGEYQAAVDVSAVMETKCAALRAHASQVAGVAYDEAALGLARYRGAMSGAGRHAEVFEILRVPGAEVVGG